MPKDDSLEIVNECIPDSKISHFSYKDGKSGHDIGTSLIIHFRNGQEIEVLFSRIHGFIV